MSNKEFAQVFQAIVSVLHSLHHLHGITLAATGCNFSSARAGQSTPVSNRLDTCDSLYVTNLASDVVSIASMHANTSFEVLAT